MATVATVVLTGEQMSSEGGFGGLVRRHRESLGMSQETLANKVGTTRAYISQIESGNKKWPRKYIVSIAVELGISEDELKGLAKSYFPVLSSLSSLRISPPTKDDGISDDQLVEVASIVRRFLKSLTPDQRSALWTMVEEADKVTDIRDERDARDQEGAEGALGEERQEHGQ